VRYGSIALAALLTLAAGPTLGGAMLAKEGTKAPAFEAQDQSGHLVKSDELIGKKAFVLWFYPKDDTPG
jgi:hypothetical protein